MTQGGLEPKAAEDEELEDGPHAPLQPTTRRTTLERADPATRSIAEPATSSIAEPTTSSIAEPGTSSIAELATVAAASADAAPASAEAPR